MSSRFVRKALGQTSENDLAEVLQKVGIDKDDGEEEESSLGASSSFGRRNLFECLAEDEEKNEENGEENSNGQSDDEQKPKETKSSKSKRKRKSKKKNCSKEKSDELDEFLLVSNENAEENRNEAPRENLCDLLFVDCRLLNPLNEMKKKFGAAVVEQIERENNPQVQTILSRIPANRRRAFLAASQQRPTTRTAKLNSFVVPKLGWPQFIKFGLMMKPTAPLDENSSTSGNFFQFHFDKDYRDLEIEYLNCVDSHNLDGIMDILRRNPFHVGALLHLSDVSRMQDDTSTAVDLNERALYSFQQSFHPLFSINRAESRLEYRIQENRPFFISIFKNIIYAGERGCPRTALEFCKVLFSLSPKEDPLAVLLLIDNFAIRSDEYQYLIRFHDEFNQRLNLDGLPNFAYSIALAHFRQENRERANLLLQDAFLRFPSTLKYLTDKLSIRPDKNVENSSFFMSSDTQESEALRTVQQLYVIRIANEWKERNEMEFMRLNANRVLEIINEARDQRIETYRTLRKTNYRKTPVNICRHIALSESNEIRRFLPNEPENGRTFYSFDPFPPENSVAGFVRPPRPQMAINSSYNPLSMMIRSLFPNFNLEDYLVPVDGQRAAGAAAHRSNDNITMLQVLQESIRNFIADIGINGLGAENDQQQEPGNDGEQFDDEFD